MRTFTYWMSATVLAAGALATSCSDDAGENVAVGGSGGGSADTAGSGGMDMSDGGTGGMEADAGAMDTAGAGGMGMTGGSGGMGMTGGDDDLDAGVDADAGDVDSGADPVVAASEFTPLYNDIFLPRCSGCHAGSYGSSDEQFSFDVISGNPEGVVGRLDGSGGNQMPLGCNNNDTCLSQDELDAVSAWVAAGTPR